MQLDEVKQLIRDIQSIISTEMTQDDESELIQLAGAHEDVVLTVIKRADAVADLLDQGLYDEAIQLSERSPMLTDLAMALDFPELPEWTCVLTDFKVAPVPELPHDTIAQLEDAYDTNADSKQLLRRFRALSIARAPLVSRIEVLRRLARVDPQNEQWTNGIRLYETHRLKVISGDLKAAFQEKNLKAVESIDREVNHSKWAVPVSANLKTKAQDAHRILRQANAREQLVSVAERLSVAYSEFSVTRAAEILPRFQALCDLAKLPSDHEVMDVAGPALDWIHGELETQRKSQERQQAIASLQAGLDNNAELNELEKHYYKATEDGEPIPQVLETRLANKIAEADATAKRKRMAVIAGSSVAVCLAVGGIIWFVMALDFNIQVDKNVDLIAKLLDDAKKSGNVTLLEKRFEELNESHPALLQAPEIAELNKSFEGLKQSEEGRIRSFNTHLTTVTSIARQIDWERVVPAEEALKNAEELSRNTNDHAAVLGAKRIFDTAKSELQARTDKEFTKELDVVQSVYDSIDGGDPDAYDNPIERLNSAMQVQHISREVQNQGNSFLTKLKTERRLAANNRKVKYDLDQISASAKSKSGFERSVDVYIRNHAGSQRAAELELIQTRESSLWSSVLEWNKFRRKLPETLHDLTPQQAQDLLESFLDFQQFEFPMETILPVQIEMVQAIANRTTSLTGSEPEISKLFASRYMRDCYVLRQGLNWYYSDAMPTIERDLIKFSYFEDSYADRPTENASFRKGDLNMEVLGGKIRDADTWLSAQSKAAREVDEILANKETPFEEKIQSVMGATLDVPDMCPIIRLLLIENYLAIGMKGSAFVDNRARAVTSSLAKIDVPRDEDYINPRTDLKTARGVAEREIRNHSHLVRQALADAILEREKTIQFKPTPELSLVGWMYKDSSDNWTISLCPDSNVPRESDLFLFYLEGDNRRVGVVGRQTATGITLTKLIAKSLFREGRPIYVKSPP